MVAHSGVGLAAAAAWAKCRSTATLSASGWSFGEVTVSFHPAGHVLGSSQIRVEHGGRGLGRLRRLQAAIPTRAASRSRSCRASVFITEATFALPIYRWDPGATGGHGRAAGLVGRRMPPPGGPRWLFCYVLGKAQRVIAESRPGGAGARWFVHGAIDALLRGLSGGAGAARTDPPDRGNEGKGASFAGALVVAPAVGLRLALAAPVRRCRHGVRLGLDAGARRTAAGGASTAAS